MMRCLFATHIKVLPSYRRPQAAAYYQTSRTLLPLTQYKKEKKSSYLVTLYSSQEQQRKQHTVVQLDLSLSITAYCLTRCFTSAFIFICYYFQPQADVNKSFTMMGMSALRRESAICNLKFSWCFLSVQIVYVVFILLVNFSECFGCSVNGTFLFSKDSLVLI